MKLTVLIPTYNDSESLLILISKIAKIAEENSQYNFTILIVDDDSSDSDQYNKLKYLNSIKIKYIKLKNNCGHQKSIFIGMLYCKKHDVSNLIIMDGDGEDNPSDIIELIKAANKNPNSIIVAKRNKRSNTFFFKMMYFFYKSIFKLLTGKTIDFGNFCFMQKKHIHKLLTIDLLKNNITATILKSKIPIYKIPLDRGSRYKGKSKMNYQYLITHGLSSLSVYSREVIIRIIIFTFFICLILFLLILITLYLRFFTNFFLGQASTIIGTLLTIGLLVLSNSVLVSFILLSKENELISDKEYNYIDFIEIEKDIN